MQRIKFCYKFKNVFLTYYDAPFNLVEDLCDIIVK